MNILTDEEINDVDWYRYYSPRQYARAVEQAVLAKLTQNVVMPVPSRLFSTYPLDGTQIAYYTEAQLKLYGSACAAAQREMKE